MIQARLADVPALAWVVGYGTARDPLGRRWGRVVAAAAWPLWVVILAALVTARAGLWHRDRAAMALVSEPSTRIRPPARAAIPVVVVGALIGAVGPATRWLALGFAVASLAAFATVLVPIPGRLRAGPRVPGPAIHVQMVAALPSAPPGALIDIARVVRDRHERTGVPVEVVARDQSRARVFARWGLQPVTAGRGRMRTPTSGVSTAE